MDLDQIETFSKHVLEIEFVFSEDTLKFVPEQER